MKAVLLSTYELGRQPFGLASAAACLRQAGVEVDCQDLSRDQMASEPVRNADLIGFYVPMHTATRLAARAAKRVKRLNPDAHLCFFGLYAPMNADYLRGLGARTIFGGEFEKDFLALAGSPPSQFPIPDRTGLPDPARYARLHWAGRHRTTGYTEATRGCKPLCRHCPVVPVYKGHFHVIPREIVLEDVRRQVAAGAEHITFGDPDFFNGPGHVLPIIEALHREFPALTYDVTIKVEHLLKHTSRLSTLRDTGCLFVTTAVESFDDGVLKLLDKGHSFADFLRVVELFRETSLTLNPTFIPFTPWITMEGYRDLLRTLQRLELVEHVSPIQLAIRLLIPAGSRLLELEEVRAFIAPFDQARLCYPWRHPDPEMDHLHGEVQKLVADSMRRDVERARLFAQIAEAAGLSAVEPPPSRAEIPYLNEPWYC